MKSYKAKTSLKLILFSFADFCWQALAILGVGLYLAGRLGRSHLSTNKSRVFSQSHKQWRAMPSALMQPQPISLTEFAANAATKWDPTTYDPVYSTSVRYNILGDLRKCVTKCARLRIFLKWMECHEIPLSGFNLVTQFKMILVSITNTQLVLPLTATAAE